MGIMLNEFTRKTRDLFDFWWYSISWETWKNNADCLHHILWRVSNSPYNAAPLNNMYDHQPEWRKWLESIHSFNVRSKYLIKTKQHLELIGYTPTKKDLEFLKMYDRYYKQDSALRCDNPFEEIAK